MKYIILLLLLPCFTKAQQTPHYWSLPNHKNDTLLKRDNFSDIGPIIIKYPVMKRHLKTKSVIKLGDKGFCCPTTEIVNAQVIKDTAYASGICSFGREALQKQKKSVINENRDGVWHILIAPRLLGYGSDIPQQKAYNKDSTISLELINMDKSTIQYVGCDTILPITHRVNSVDRTDPNMPFVYVVNGQLQKTKPRFYIARDTLWGAEATSIYGAQAARGAIIFKTKKQ